MEKNGISAATFEQLFPFFFVVNQYFEIESLGASLAHLLENHHSTRECPVPFSDLFSSASTSNINDFDTLITLTGQLIELILTPLDLSFKGQIIVSECAFERDNPSDRPQVSPQKIIFCGSPSIKDFTRFKALGLSTSKFALHDMTISHAVLLDMYKTQMSELHSLNARLKRSANEKKQLLEEVTFQATYDNLTGLINRRNFCMHLKKMLASFNKDQPVGMCIIGLDDFKSINDLLGHQAGDACLIEITRRLKQECQPQDIVSRIGGDEFALLLINRANADRVYTDIVHLLKAIQEPFTIGHEKWTPSASVGLEFLTSNLSVTQLLRRCDDAMHEAKLKHKGGFVIYNDQMSERQQQRNFVHKHLEQAIQNGDLRAFFQPIVDTHTGVAYAIEALARWKNPKGGWIPPLKFIPHIEGSDLSIVLGNAMIDNSLKSLAELHQQLGQRFLSVSINTTARQLYGNTLINSLKMYCEQYSIAPHNIILEITETSLLMDESSVKNLLTQLKNMGIKIALDDFGTGFSSLSYLSRFPFDVLKIDRAFIRDIHQQEVNKKLVAAIVNMAKALDLRVVAEGIEKKEELSILNDLNVSFIQGYYYAKPLPLNEAIVFLKT